jgi:hypothetical protein
MDKHKLRLVEKALNRLAVREGKSVSEIRKEIQKAMLVGLCSQDQKVQIYWRHIPCEGDVPTPEEVVAFMVDEATGKRQVLQYKALSDIIKTSPKRRPCGAAFG